MFARRTLFAPLSVMLAFGLTTSARAQEIDNAARYRTCITLVDKEPGQAFSNAIRWRDLGGDEGADHCAALALIRLEQYGEGANRLEKLATRSRRAPAFRARILAQAGQAWLLAGDAKRAEAVATSALTLAPNDTEILIDRAEARAQLADYKGALTDLDVSLSGKPGNVDALVFRATSKRFLGNFTGALADIEAALAINTIHPDALLELGILKRLAHDKPSARVAWLKLLAVAPTSVAAETARTNLEKMDVKPNP